MLLHVDVDTAQDVSITTCKGRFAWVRMIQQDSPKAYQDQDFIGGRKLVGRSRRPELSNRLVALELDRLRSWKGAVR